MKLIKGVLPIVIIVIVGIYSFSFFYSENIVDNELQNRQIEALKYENNTLKRSNDLLDDKVEVLKIINDCLITQIDKEQEEIQQLRKNKYDKISAIHNYNDDELYLYFSGFNTESTTD